jgi:hypothetical protein
MCKLAGALIQNLVVQVQRELGSTGRIISFTCAGSSTRNTAEIYVYYSCGQSRRFDIDSGWMYKKIAGVSERIGAKVKGRVTKVKVLPGGKMTVTVHIRGKDENVVIN